MKKLILIIFIFYSQINLCNSQTNDSLLKEFRSITIQNGQKINLQTNIDKLKDVVIKSTKYNYYLKKGTFIRSDSINIEVDKHNLIIAIYFNYDTTYNFLKGLYFKSIGNGEEFNYSSKRETIRVTKWEDNQTIFELVEIKENGTTKTYSKIFDKKYFFGNKNTRNKYSNNSIELLRHLSKN